MILLVLSAQAAQATVPAVVSPDILSEQRALAARRGEIKTVIGCEGGSLEHVQSEYTYMCVRIMYE